MKISRFFFILLLVLAALWMLHPLLLGKAVEPVLENLLVDAFDMPVHVEGVKIYPAFSRVTVQKIEFLNPPGFRRRDQFTAKGITLELDLRVLKNKFIRIRKAHFKEVVFAIESYMTSQGSRTNVWHWYHHMGLDEEDEPLPPRSMPHPENIGEDSWRVRIDRLDLENGTIIFDDRREPEEQRWIFQRIKGYWTGFDFLSDYVSPTFTETIQVEATFGSNPPAYFKGGGQCQFADGDNFNVRTEITGGSIAEYNFLVKGIFGEVEAGTFDLKSHLICVEGDLKSDHQLTLRSMRLAAPTPAKKILNYPMDAVRFLLENEKTVELNIRVDGYIGDPKFRLFSAFTQALQKALVYKTKTGLEGTVKLAASAPVQVKSGLSRLGGLLIDPFARRNGSEETQTNGNGENA
jgi:hypothetical protein